MVLPDHYRATRDEVEEYFGFPTRRALELFALHGGGPVYEKMKRRCYYRIGDVEKWLRAHAISSASDEIEAA